MSDRFYSEEEVNQLIQRAVELEADRSVSREKDDRAGLSLTELENIAAESGIDPELIRHAAKEMESSSSESNKSKTEKTKVAKEEIFCERWIDAQLDNDILDDLATELNHKYGAWEANPNWWNRYWKEGYAKNKKTSTSLDWSYTDNYKSQSTRVLIQNRGDRCRIRVSKRKLWGQRWDNIDSWGLITALIIFTVFGGKISSNTFDSLWLGLIGGIILSFALYPVIKYFRKRYIDKHRQEVTETANELAELATRLSHKPIPDQQQERAENKKDDLTSIEYSQEDGNFNNDTDTNRIRNELH